MPVVARRQRLSRRPAGGRGRRQRLDGRDGRVDRARASPGPRRPARLEPGLHRRQHGRRRRRDRRRAGVLQQRHAGRAGHRAPSRHRRGRRDGLRRRPRPQLGRPRNRLPARHDQLRGARLPGLLRRAGDARPHPRHRHVLPQRRRLRGDPRRLRSRRRLRRRVLRLLRRRRPRLAAPPRRPRHARRGHRHRLPPPRRDQPHPAGRPEALPHGAQRAVDGGEELRRGHAAADARPGAAAGDAAPARRGADRRARRRARPLRAVFAPRQRDRAPRRDLSTRGQRAAAVRRRAPDPRPPGRVARGHRRGHRHARRHRAGAAADPGGAARRRARRAAALRARLRVHLELRLVSPDPGGADRRARSPARVHAAVAAAHRQPRSHRHQHVGARGALPGDRAGAVERRPRDAGDAGRARRPRRPGHHCRLRSGEPVEPAPARRGRRRDLRPGVRAGARTPSSPR